MTAPVGERLHNGVLVVPQLLILLVTLYCLEADA